MPHMRLLFAEEGEEYHSECVDRCNEGSDQRREKKPYISFFTCPGQPKDLIFAVESGRNKRQRCKGSRSDQEGPVDHRESVFQSTHFKHVMLVMKDVNHGAGGKEKQGLEKSMDHK